MPEKWGTWSAGAREQFAGAETAQEKAVLAREYALSEEFANVCDDYISALRSSEMKAQKTSRTLTKLLSHEMAPRGKIQEIQKRSEREQTEAKGQLTELGSMMGKMLVKRITAIDSVPGPKHYRQIYETLTSLLGKEEANIVYSGFLGELVVARVFQSPECGGRVYFPTKDEDADGVDWWVSLGEKDERILAVQVKTLPFVREGQIAYAIRTQDDVERAAAEISKVLQPPPDPRYLSSVRDAGRRLLRQGEHGNVTPMLILLPSRGSRVNDLDAYYDRYSGKPQKRLQTRIQEEFESLNKVA